MAVSLAAQSLVTGSDLAGGSGSISISPPSGLAAGDLWLVLLVSDSVGGDIGAPGGWTQAGSAVVGGVNGYTRLEAFWKIAGGSESAASFTRASETWITLAYNLRFTGVHASTPVGNVASVAPASQAVTITPDAPDVTIQADGSLAVLVVGWLTSGGFATTAAVPSGTAALSSSSLNGYPQIRGATEARNAGAYAPSTWSLTTDGSSYCYDAVGLTIEVRPAAGGSAQDLAGAATAGASATADLAHGVPLSGAAGAGATGSATLSTAGAAGLLLRIERGKTIGRGFGRGFA
jgi:hypothetical protein